MNKLGEMFLAIKIKTLATGRSIIKKENGDTNFVSIAIIIAIIIALAGALLTWGPDLIELIGEKSKNFVNDTAQ